MILFNKSVKLDEAILLTTIDLKEPNFDELDVEAALEFVVKLGLQIDRCGTRLHC